MPEIDIHWIGYTVYAPGTHYGPYTTASHEFVWIDHGSAALTAGERTHELPPGTVVLSRPGQRQTYRWDPEHTTRHGYVQFTMSAADDTSPTIRRLTEDDVILSLAHHIRWLDTERPPGWPELANAALSYALRAFTAGASRTSGPGEQDMPPVIQRSMALVRRRWALGHPLRAVPLAELAMAAAVTPEHLCRVFRKEVGYSPAAALRLLRLNRAAGLLARSNLTVAEAAREGGFPNQFHFSRVFKQAFCCSPSEFRRNRSPGVDLPPAIRRLATYL